MKCGQLKTTADHEKSLLKVGVMKIKKLLL